MSERNLGTERRGLFRLIADVPGLIVQLFRDELESLKQEIAAKVKGVAVGAALFVAAAFVAVLMLIVLVIAGIFGIAAAGLPYWAAALIVAGALLVIALVLALIGKAQFGRGDPGRTVASVKKDVDVIKGIDR